MLCNKPVQWNYRFFLYDLKKKLCARKGLIKLMFLQNVIPIEIILAFEVNKILKCDERILFPFYLQNLDFYFNP